MDFKNYIFVLITFFIFLFSSSVVNAFEDNFDKQLEPGQMFSDKWVTSIGDGWRVDITSSPMTTYNKILRIENYFAQAATTGASATTIIPSSSNYWSMQVVQFSYTGTGGDFVKAQFFNSTGISIGNYPIQSYLQTYSSGTAKSVLYEFTSDSSNMFLKVNGTTINLGTINGTPEYFRLSAETGNRRLLLYVEMVTNQNEQIGIGTDSQRYAVTELNNPAMNISWLTTTTPQTNFENSEMKIKICKISGTCLRETVVKNVSNITSSSGYDSFNWQTLLGITNYGLYFSYLLKNEVLVASDYFFFVPPGISSSVTAADTSAVIGQTETITYSLGAPDFIGSSYYVNVYSLYGLITSIPVTSASGTVTWDTSGNSVGLYFITLSQVTSGIQTDLAYTTINLVATLLIRGYVYDAQNATNLSGVNLNFSQNTIWYNTTSAIDGSYNLSELFVGLNTTVRASKVGWTHNNFSFTPLAAQVYTINLYMLNTTSGCGGTTLTCINGIVEDIPYHQAIGGTTVNLGNGTYSASTISNTTTGFYIFQNLADDNLSYTVNATKNNFRNSIDYNVTTINSTYVSQIILMSEIYTLSIVAQDASNANTILDFIAIFNGSTYNTSIGSITIPNLIYGSYLTIISSPNYISSSQTILVDSTKTATFYLNSVVAAPTNTNFKTLPHNVRFQIQDYAGNAHVGIPITIQGWSTTVGTWAQLAELIGLNFATTPINNATMTGSTGIDGSATFMMIDTVYYTVNFNGGTSYNITWNLYPKEDFYLLLIPLSTPNGGCSQNVTWNLNQTIINSTHTALSLTYLDPNNHVTLINFFVQNNQSVTLYSNSTNISSWTNSYNVNSSITGTTYFWGFNSTEIGGCTLAQTKAITFRGSGKLIDLHIDEPWYQWISIIIIVFVAALFSIRKVKFGVIITPFVAGGVWYFGWFTINPILLAITITLGILIYLRTSEQKVIY